jgi:hypothetical protein
MVLAETQIVVSAGILYYLGRVNRVHNDHYLLLVFISSFINNQRQLPHQHFSHNNLTVEY